MKKLELKNGHIFYPEGVKTVGQITPVEYFECRDLEELPIWEFYIRWEKPNFNVERLTYATEAAATLERNELIKWIDECHEGEE